VGFFERKNMEKEQNHDLQDALSAIFSPAATFEEADEVMTPMELLKHLTKETGLKLTTPQITAAMTLAGFRREAIEARTYWLIKFA